MNRKTCAGLALLAIVACMMQPVSARAAQDDATLLETLDAYVEGWYAGDAARIETATHPDLIRRKPALSGTDGAIQLEEIDQLGLLVAARSGLGRRAPAEDRKRMTTEVLDQRSVSALALVETGGTFSYLQLVRNAGRWQVLNVLWEPKLSADEGRDMHDAALVEATVQDYLQGWYTGDAERMRRALHPELIKRKPALLNRAGDIRIDTLDANNMIAATRAGRGTRTPAAKQLKTLKVLDIRGRSALALLETGEFFDYIALARNKGQWLIVNVLWEPNIE
ncbi:nuclear transport factor 2 family protein [Niveibacterium sp. 24ML]|uniref:nuclear transport factor 2 family protein n=1 Tax=Niveibacterium sp. 24ML TaxID=2985512 RepID=UPI0022710C3C|nr:nuclear transport factor 2 family protein [Niveibacterium sp. 24ML]MCX9155617.1 nuclear transport factor 2 family protein [Niveibacterium sp. 24ML]